MRNHDLVKKKKSILTHECTPISHNIKKSQTVEVNTIDHLCDSAIV